MKEHFDRQLRGYSNNPTYGERGARAFLKRIPDEEFPNNVGFNPKFQGQRSYGKRTRFNAGIIESFLHSRVGMHWNDVKQEICKVSIPKGTTSWRDGSLYTIIERYVEMDPYIVDGVAYRYGNYVSGYQHQRKNVPITGFYLDENYILRVQSKRPRYGNRNITTTSEKILERDGKKYSVLYGYWHEQTEQVVKTSKRTVTRESMREYQVHQDPARLIWVSTPVEYTVIDYRQLSKRELKRLHLYNKNTFMSQEQKELGFTKYNDLKAIPPAKLHNQGW